MKDQFGREISYLRVSLTDRCNLRCRYCMPEDGVEKRSHREMMTEEELLQAIGVAAALGIRKVRLTGGEPLVKKNILSIIEGVVKTPGIEELVLTTNGILLPKMAASLKSAGIQRVNISLDTLKADKYAYITRVGKLEEALKGIDASLEVGFDQIKINIVLIGGFNDDEISDFVDLTRDRPLEVRFIELMPMVGHAEFGPQAYLPAERVLQEVPGLEVLEDEDGVAKLYQLPGALGRVGLIKPLSDHFCGKCNRIRLLADGSLKPCLHAPAEFSLRGLDPEGMRSVFLKAIGAKPQEHGDLSVDHLSQAGRDMNTIGG